MPTEPADIRVLVDWNNDGDYDDSYDEITDDVLEVSWQRGRDYASQLSGRSTAGKLTARLKNNDGKYSPSNTSSVLTGNILPGRSVRLNAGGGTFPYEFPIAFGTDPQFVGKLERITPTPAAHGLKTCTLTAYGTLGYLNDFRPSLATQIDQRTDQALGAILDDVGWPADDRNLDTGKTTMTRFWVDGPKTLDAMRIVEETEGGFIKEEKDGKVGFENRHTRLLSPYNTSQATFSDASDATRTYTVLTQEDPLSTITNHFESSARTYTTAGVAVLWTHPETGADSPLLTAGQARTFEAIYPNPSSANNALEVNAWTTPAATTDYLGNTASDGSGTNLTASIAVSVAKTSERMVITLTNNHASSSAYMTKIQARGTAVTSNDPVKLRAIDTASQTDYGERKYVAKTEFFPSSAEAQNWGDYQNAIFGSPINILTMEFNANATEENLAEALGRDISDRVTITATNNANLGINADFFIESIRHHISQGTKLHKVAWKLSPASGGYSAFWVLNTGALNVSTVPAY